MKFPEQYRYDPGGYYTNHPGDTFGAFIVPAHKAPGRRDLHIIAADGTFFSWEHASVSLGPHAKKTPTWEEMCFVKDLFWDEEECVVQYHPPKAEYVNFHPGVLHLWRPVNETIPLPPKVCV